MTIISFNISPGASLLKFNWAYKTSRLFPKADIVFLQEFEDTSTLTRLHTIQHKYNYLFSHFLPTRYKKRGKFGHGLAVLSRIPLKHLSNVPLTQYSLGRLTRSRAAAIYQTPGGQHLANIHLDTRLNPEHRIAQIKPLIHVLHPIHQTLIAGDLNTLPYRFNSHYVPHKIINQKNILNAFLSVQGYVNIIPPHMLTYRITKLNWNLDTFYLKNLSAHAYGIDKQVKVSDHWPIWVNIST